MSAMRPKVDRWHVPKPPPWCKSSTDRADALLSLDNFNRYRAQSEATRDNAVAPLPPRAKLSKELAPA